MFQPLALYLKLVFPWNPEYQQLWKCVTTIFPKRGTGEMITTNHAVQTYDDLVRLIETRKNWTRAGVYVALGTQRMAGTEYSQDGFIKAVRKKENMVSFNALFMDIDVKPGAYADTMEAMQALIQFQKDSGIPKPTMIVESGSGGIHPYWCTDKPMDLQTWLLLAEALKAASIKHGLKTDVAVTADAARILRVPTTFNYKSGQPVAVNLLQPDELRIYTISGLSGMLQQYASAQRTGTGPSTAKSNWSQNFTGGVDERSVPNVTIDQIAANCPATAQTLTDGGAGKAEPEWSQDMFLAAWTTDPTDAAHRLSKGHATYSIAGTDKKLAEKKAAIASSNLGWPKCVTFGHTACKTCPLLQFGKSPINFAIVSPTQPKMQPLPNDDLVPEPYWRTQDMRVFMPDNFGPREVLGSYPILDGGIDRLSGELVLKTSISGQDRWGSLAPTKHTGAGICEALAKGTRNGILINGPVSVQNTAKGFVMAWMTHLQQRKKFVQPHSFGWSGNGFVFGDYIYTPTGPESVYRGSSADDKYRTEGELDPWTAAVELVYGNAGLEVLVAAAFAAPLVELACDASLTLSLYSYESGYGKTNAMKIAQAVWGQPRTGMSALDDTNNFTMGKVIALKNLPVFYDEIKTAEQYDRMVELVFAVAQGRQKGRLKRDSSAMDIGMATTMLIVASNHGVQDAVVRATEGTQAGGLRVFECNVPPLVNVHTTGDVEALIRPLNENYGNPAAVYTQFIVTQRDAVRKVLDVVRRQLETACKFTASERFWEHMMVTLITGAHLANKCGLTKFDISGMQSFLVQALSDMRSTALPSTYSMSGPDAAEDVISELLSDLRGRHMVVTDVVPRAGAGRPVTQIKPDFMGGDPLRMDDIWLQFGKTDGRILCRYKQFNAWFQKRKRSPEQAIKAIRKDYVVTKRRAAIGAGVDYLGAFASLRSECYDFEPKVAPSHNPSSPFSNFGSPAPTTPAS